MACGESLLCRDLLSGEAGCDCWEAGFIFPVGLFTTHQVWMTVLSARGKPHPMVHI